MSENRSQTGDALETRKSRGSAFYIVLFALVAALVLAAWLSWWLWVSQWASPATGLSAGEYGDMFGGINALFAGVAFAALVVTLVMQSEQLQLQRQELQLQRKELEQTREELRRQADASETTTALLKRQWQIDCRLAVESYRIERQRNRILLSFDIIVRNPNPTTLRLERITAVAIDKAETTPDHLWHLEQDESRPPYQQLQEVLYGAQRTFHGIFTHPEKPPRLLTVAVFDQSGGAWGLTQDEKRCFQEAAAQFERDKLTSLSLHIAYNEDGSFSGANYDAVP